MLLNLGGRCYALDRYSNIEFQIAQICAQINTTFDNFKFHSNGKLLSSFEQLSDSAVIHCFIPLKGGKGGYGAKLKTEGGKKVRPNDNMFSRDGHGRRLNYTTIEKQYTQFCKKKLEEDDRVSRQREQFKVMENTLRQGQSFMKLDKIYKQELEESEKSLFEAIKIGKMRLIEKNKATNEQKKQEQKKQQKELTQQIKQINQQQKKSEKIELSQCQENKKRERQEQKQEISQPRKMFIKNQKSPVFLSAAEKLKSLFKK